MVISILGCGWLGRPLASALLKKGYTVKGSTTRTEKIQPLNKQGIDASYIVVEPDEIKGDIDDFLDADVVVFNFPPGRRDDEVVATFPDKIVQLLKALNRQRDLPRVVFVSSTSVYGNNSGKVVSESSGLRPEKGGSGEALARVEMLLQEKLPEVTILRFGGLVGYNRKPGRFLAGRSNLPGGLAPVNLLHQDDAIRAICAVIERGKWNQIYNVVAPAHPSRADFYRYAARKQQLPEPTFLEEEISVLGKQVDSSKFEMELDFKFRYEDPFEMIVEPASV